MWWYTMWFVKGGSCVPFVPFVLFVPWDRTYRTYGTYGEKTYASIIVWAMKL